MRKALLTILCLMAVCCSHMAPSAQKMSSVQKEFLSLVKGAEELRIRDFSADENRHIIEVDLLKIRDPNQIAQWTNAIVLVETPHTGVDPKTGETYYISNCLCLGGPIFEFYRKNKQLLRFTLHHGSHIRSELINEGGDTDLSDESKRELSNLLLCCLDEKSNELWQNREKPRPLKNDDENNIE